MANKTDDTQQAGKAPVSDNYLNHTRGIASWAFTLDHKRIGVMYLVSILIALFLGGTFAGGIRTELLTPGPTMGGRDESAQDTPDETVSEEDADKEALAEGSIEKKAEDGELAAVESNEESGEGAKDSPKNMYNQPMGKKAEDRELLAVESNEKYGRGAKDSAKNLYNQMFTLHGAIMIFLFIIPGIPAALGNFVLPMMLGAQDVAFPRLNLFSYYLWTFGATFFILTMVMGGLDTGWTFYTPYSTSTDTSVLSAGIGVFILGFSSIFTGVNFIVTIHTLRPPGMGWFKMPLFVWSLYATAIIQILATPIIGITVLLLALEILLGIGIFDPKLGGDPILFQHFFWFYSHPAVYIMILPAMGVISELIPTFSRKHIFGYRFIAYSSVAIALLGFLVWGHHMFVSGQSRLVAMIFSFLTFSVSIPSAIKVFNWLATMYKGSIRLYTPMYYALSFILLFGIGGLTGLFLGALSTNIQLHDTYFVVAHFHYTMFGGVLIAFLGGLHYWWPKITGRMYNELAGRIASVGVFIGFNLTFFPQFVLGTQGMPRRYYMYPEKFQTLHVMSSIGAFLTFASMFLILIYLLHSLRKGRPAPDNPWGAGSAEWKCSSPPPYNNFDTPPESDDPYDYSGLRYDESIQGFVPIDA